VKNSRWLRLGTMAALVIGISNCGGGGGTPTSVTPTPTPIPTPVPSVRTLIGQGSSKLEQNFFTYSPPLAIQAASDLELIVDWTFADSNMFTFIASAPCDGTMFNANQCNVLQQSGGTTPKPRRLVAPRAAAGSYVFLIANSGPHSESFSYQIFRVTPPSATSTTFASQLVDGFAVGQDLVVMSQPVRRQ
jgi:hypothetical protein